MPLVLQAKAALVVVVFEDSADCQELQARHVVVVVVVV